MKNTAGSRGFTLIELMITVAVVAILASVAYPSYLEHVRKGRRAAAQAQMMDIANRQQQILLANRAYATEAALESGGFSLPPEVGAHYNYSVTLGGVVGDAASCATAAVATMPAFTVTFTPTGSQVPDGTLALDSRGVKCPATKW